MDLALILYHSDPAEEDTALSPPAPSQATVVLGPAAPANTPPNPRTKLER